MRKRNAHSALSSCAAIGDKNLNSQNDGQPNRRSRRSGDNESTGNRDAENTQHNVDKRNNREPKAR